MYTSRVHASGIDAFVRVSGAYACIGECARELVHGYMRGCLCVRELVHEYMRVSM